MFKDLDWGWAVKRAAVVVVIYLALMYILSAVAPGSFDLSGQWPSLITNAVIFFFVFTLIYAVIERSRRRRMASQSTRTGQKAGEEERDDGPLKGKANPNTSRKKATRRRR